VAETRARVMAYMTTFLITSFFLLAAIVYVVYLWQRSDSKPDHALPPHQPVTLFGGDEPAVRQLAEHKQVAEERRAALITKASEGDKETLWEAHRIGEADLYDEILNRLVEHAAGSDAKFLALISFIARSDELRANKRLAYELMGAWKSSPDNASTAKMLHIAALSDDAQTYQRGVDSAHESWRSGQLPGMPGEELRALIEGEYWVLSTDARRSGAGFVLKRRLAALRRELATEARPA
jgi:hypothetical protein